MKIRNIRLGKWNIVLLFFIIMFACTIISRAADSMTVPKVRTGKAKGGTINYILKGEGVITGESEELVFLPEGYRVVSVISVGAEVKAGDVLAVFDKKALEDKKEFCRSELTKLNLSLEQEKLNSQPSAWLKEQDSAAKNVETINQELNSMQASLEQKQSEYQQKMSDGNAGDEERQGLKSEIAELEAGIKSMRKNLIQAQDDLEQAKSRDAATEENNKKQQQIAELSIQSLQLDIAEKQKEADKINELLANEGNFISEVEGTVTDTTAAAGNITGGTEYFKIGKGNTKMMADLNIESANGLKENDGITITSKFGGAGVNGKVVSVHEKSGIQNASGGSDGSERMGGGLSGLCMEMTAQLENNNFTIGQKVDFKAVKESKEYKTIIPITAIREDSDGKYVLIIEEKNSIMGKEKVAARVAIKILEKNDSEAAVESAIVNDDMIILGSNKAIKAGDRIRME